MSEVPRTFTPHPHQREGLDFLRDVQRPALWMPMGGGKSITTLTALLDLDYCEEVFPALVLAPLRVANGTWVREVEKWEHTKHLTVSAIAARRNPKTSATEAARSAALRARADIYTLPYGSLTWLIDKLGDDWPFKTVIADESTRLKNFRIRQGAKNPRALGKVAHSKVNRFINLTGTPGSNGLKDLWGPAWFQDKGDRLGRTYSAFEQRWFRKGFDGYSLEPMEHTEREIHAKLRDICLTVRGLEVAEPIRNIIDVELEPGVRQHYRSMEKNFWADIGENGVEAANAAVKANKLLQITGGNIFTDEYGNYEAIHELKLDALESVVEEAAGTPVFVSYNFQPEIERILKRFPGARHLDADPKTEDDWNAGRIRMLVAHPASAGHGLNLQDGGNILVFYGIGWDLELHDQIIERIGPQRQKQSGYDRNVYIHYILASGTIDEIVFERLQSKRSVREVLLEAMERRER